MNINKILAKVDHTNLSQTATWADIKKLCDEGIKYKTASVCIPAFYVKDAALYVNNQLKVCTVIGFPNGYSTTKSKCFDTSDALENGAVEIDMVINIGLLKDEKYHLLSEEISAIKSLCGNNVLKVIIENCLLTDEEKIKMCEIIANSGADYIKTSTGFSKSGATEADVALFSQHITGNLKIKAAGGIRTLEDAEKFINLGADRIGASSLINSAQKSFFK